MMTAERAGNRVFATEADVLTDVLDDQVPEQHSPEAMAMDGSLKMPALASVYEDAAIRPSLTGYTILKVVEMANSPHILGMSTEARRNALLMALDAAGVDINFLVADAISRQRALKDREETLLTALRQFESDKAEDVKKRQAEMDWLTAQCKAKVQSNEKEVAREQAAFHAWQRIRREESRRIADMATLLVPPESETGGDSLAALLERAGTSRK